jgi:predicted acetyltransferase
MLPFQPMPSSFRPAREDDLERLLEIHDASYPDSRGRDARVRNLLHNPLGNLADLFVATEGGAVVGHGFLFPLEAWFGGLRVPVAGVASIGVAPESRGRGVASRLVEHLHGVARARGDVLAVLYPFRHGFYARLGYASTSPFRRLRLHPASIPFRASLRARAAHGGDLPAMCACWEAEARRHSGAMVRPDALWEARLSDERLTWIVVESDAGGVEGYVAWTLSQTEAHAKTVLEVNDMAARTDAGARSLWGVLAAQRDQVAEVAVDVSAADPFDRALVDADRGHFGTEAVEHALGELAAGPMVRALDVVAALRARGYAAEGSLAIGVGAERVELAVSAGRAEVRVAAGPSPDLRLTAPAMSAVAFGALRMRDAALFGWVEARDERVLFLADAIFALPPYFSRDPF